jgi:hypothetical protein
MKSQRARSDHHVPQVRLLTQPTRFWQPHHDGYLLRGVALFGYGQWQRLLRVRPRPKTWHVCPLTCYGLL